MVGCYILFSAKLQKYYIGATQEDISIRIDKHNLGSYGKHRLTAVADDEELFLFISANDYPHAIRLERKIRSMKSTKYVTNLVSYPEMLEKLVSSTRLSR